VVLEQHGKAGYFRLDRQACESCCRGAQKDRLHHLVVSAFNGADPILSLDAANLAADRKAVGLFLVQRHAPTSAFFQPNLHEFLSLGLQRQ